MHMRGATRSSFRQTSRARSPSPPVNSPSPAPHKSSGRAHNHLTVSGSGKSRVFDVTNSNSTVEITGLRIANGNSGIGFGGGVLNYGKLSLIGDDLSKNTAGSTWTKSGYGGGGGGLMNYGTVVATNCAFDSNSAVAYDLSNYGGGAVFNAGSLTLLESTVSRNQTSLSPTVTTSHGGDVAGVGGIYNGGSLLAINSTIALNVAGGGSAGGLWNPGTATLINCTVVQNSGGFVAGGIESFGGLTLGNTIVAQNTFLPFHGPSPDLDANGAFFNSLGGNLIGVAPPVLFTASDKLGTLGSPLNPDLLPLGYNGGQTETMTISTFASPVFNGGNNGVAAVYGLTTDQRGYARVVNGTVDIGAVENPLFLIVI